MGLQIIQGWDGTWWKVGEAVKDQLGHRGQIVELVSAGVARVEWPGIGGRVTGEFLSNLRKLPAHEGGYHVGA